jgi:hypothetical protein
MRSKLRIALPIFALTLASAARTAAVPADPADELRAASVQLAQAALLRNVANDRTEAQHLLAARDLLREAEPSLAGPLRDQAQELEYEISRHAGAPADQARPPALSALAPLTALTPLDRNNLGELAQRGQALARLVEDAR